MKKTIITILTMMFLIGFASAYMEDKVFCTLSKNSITVTMERENNYKCSEYLSVLSKSINTEYQNVVSIQALIDQGYDVDFWKEIRESKRDKIKKMLSIKEQIETAVKEFDTNMFIKLKDYLIYSTATDRSNYKKTLKYIGAIEAQGGYVNYTIKKKLNYMTEAIKAIDTINSTDDFATLIKNFNRYIYLKNQIIGK